MLGSLERSPLRIRCDEFKPRRTNKRGALKVLQPSTAFRHVFD
jgi:hypothetical protein